MARQTDDTDILLETDPQETEQQEREQALLSELDTAGGDVVFGMKIYAVQPGASLKGVRDAWLFDCDGSEYNSVRARLRDDYGTGLYRIRLFKNGKLYRSFDWQIQALAKPSPATIAPDTATGLADMMARMMAASEARMEKLIVTVLAARPQPLPPSDPLDQFAKMAGIFATLSRPTPSAVVDPSAHIDLLMKGIELGKAVTSEGGETGPMDVIGKFLTPEVIGRLMTPPPQAPIINHPPGVVAIPQTAPQPAPQSAPSNNNAGINTFPGLMGFLISRAAANSDPALYADLVFDVVSVGDIKTLIAMPDPFGELSKAFPAMAAYKGWFDQLFTTLKTITAQQTEAA